MKALTHSLTFEQKLQGVIIALIGMAAIVNYLI
jgi:hypothetical protein